MSGMGRGDVGSGEVLEGETLGWAAAIDVAKASGMVCTRVPGPGGSGRVQRVWSVASLSSAILELADELVGLGIERVVMESTGVYWKPFYYLLEAAGLQVWLVNARDVRNVPGRPKTDRLDAIWLCKLNERCVPRSCRPRRSGRCVI
jgi:transposase